MSRELVWIEQQHFRGFGCSVCGWRFRPSGALTGTSFDEMMRNFELQREKEFTSHVCADHSKGVRQYQSEHVLRRAPLGIAQSRLVQTFLKSRGMGHSSDVYKLILNDDGIQLVPMDADATAGPNQKMRVGKSITVRKQ